MDVSIRDGICVVKRVLLNAYSVSREKHHLLNEPLYRDCRDVWRE